MNCEYLCIPELNIVMQLATQVSQPIAGGRVGGGDGLPGVMPHVQAPKPLAQPSFPGTAGFVMPAAAPSPLSQPLPPIVKPETQPATQTNAFHGYPTTTSKGISIFTFVCLNCNLTSLPSYFVHCGNVGTNEY
jgi:hypothetical protein